MPSEIAPGTYRATDTGTLCRVYRDNIYLVASGPGRVTFAVEAAWSTISISNCTTFEAHTPSHLAAFGDGAYLVPSEIAPGTYRAADTGTLCRVYHDNIYLVASGPGRVTFVVEAAWSTLSISNCTTFSVHTPGRLTAFGDGAYLVPSEIAPETYRAADTGTLCRVYRDNIYLVASGPGRVTFVVEAAWSTISISNCTTFEVHTPSHLAAFGDGAYLVPSEIAPGTYRAADTGTLCRVYRDNIYLVASGPGRVTFAVEAAWSTISISNCTTFEAHTPGRLTAFGDGAYLVPSEIAPGTYRAADTGTLCRVYRDNIYLVASGPGRVTFAVEAAWSTLSISNCTTFEVHTPSHLAAFGDGAYLVPSEIAPETYRAADTGSRCRVYRDNVHLVTSGPGRVTFEVQAEWSSIRLSECGTFELHSPSRLTSFGDGVYVVPSEVAPGTYSAADTGSRCDVYRDNVHLVTSGPGRVTFEVQAEWSSIRVSECGTFELYSPSRITSFGDGTYLVPSEVAPGTYRAADTGSRCDVYRDNVHLVTSGPGRVTFEVQAAWSSIRVRDCGTFEVHTPSRLASFGDGVYLVPSELAPGTYSAADTGSRCRVYRDNVHLVTSGPGRVTFEVQAEWSSIRVRDCGTFELQAP